MQLYDHGGKCGRSRTIDIILTIDASQGKDVDLLFGLDMLKRHQATIDLARDALIIQGRELPFLPEHEVPKAGHEEEYELDG